jgi:asparagine synthase (glutamine-hydrolysing)
MCGISGLFKTGAPLEEIVSMVNSIRHRGPDAQEVFKISDEGLALGHARLSIVDIEGGTQPMTDVFGRYTVVFNGEIYGFKELKEQYSDYPYQTNSDTELIFAMLYKHGQSFVNFLPGMFAFAIYDNLTDTLFGARDRFGEKPFYYTTTLGGFAFASEIKALKVLFKERGLSINRRAIASYLERLYVPVNECIYNEIHKLLPGHAFTFRQGKLEIFQYWSIPTHTIKISFEDAVDKVYEKLKISVEKQLIADVEVGAFLSGGIDSSLITAIANKKSNKPISTYSFGFTSTTLRNELADAKKHSEIIGTNHHEFDEGNFDLFKEFLRMQEVFDEPFGDSSCIPMYIISNYASQHGRVVLTGDGGDELFGGYSQWNNKAIQFANIYQKNSFNFHLRELKEFGKIAIKGRLSFYRKLKRTKAVLNAYRHIHEKNNIFFNWKQLNQLGLPAPYPYIYTSFANNSLSDILNTDILNYMPADILVKTDMTSMANGLELRAPFLDVDLAQYAISLPVEYKTTGDINKKILRRVMEKYHPELEIQEGKLGFGAPVDEWLKLDAFQKYKYQLQKNNKAPIYNYLDYSKTVEYLKRDNYKTWLLLNLNSWLEQNIVP